MAKSPWGLDDVEQKLARVRREVPAEVALVTQSYFEASWRKQGWDGKQWKEVLRRIPGTAAYKYPKKRALGRRTRNILVATGRTRRAFACISKRWERIEIINSSPQAEFLNDGTENMVARPFIGQTEELTRMQVNIITKAIDSIFK